MQPLPATGGQTSPPVARLGTDVAFARTNRTAASPPAARAEARAGRSASPSWCSPQAALSYAAKRCAARARAFAASTSRSFGGAVVRSSLRSTLDAAVTASIARWNASSLAREGRLKPLILRTYWTAAARISSWEAGGSKLWSVLMFRHMNRSVDGS